MNKDIYKIQNDTQNNLILKMMERSLTIKISINE